MKRKITRAGRLAGPALFLAERGVSPKRRHRLFRPLAARTLLPEPQARKRVADDPFLARASGWRLVAAAGRAKGWRLSRDEVAIGASNVPPAETVLFQSR